MSSSETEDETVQLPSELSHLTTLINDKPEAFASGEKAIQDAALAAAKYIFDLTLKSESCAQPCLAELLQSIEPTQAPQTRSQARAAAQSGSTRTSSVSHAILAPTPLSALFIEDMEEDQVWAQLELKAKSVCKTLEDAFDAGDMDARGSRELNGDGEGEGEESDSDDFEGLGMEGLEGMGTDGQDWEMDDSDEDEEDEEDSTEEDDEEEGSSDDEDIEDEVAELQSMSSEEEGTEDEDAIDLDAGPSTSRLPRRESRGKRHAELDDDFFNLVEFNAEIEEAESKSVSRGALGKDADSDESEDEDAVDFFAPVDDTGASEEHEMDSTEAYYRDFFEPPPKQASKGKRKAEASPSKSRSSKVRFNDEVKVKTIKSKGKGRSLSDDTIWSSGDEEKEIDHSFTFGDKEYDVDEDEDEDEGELGSEDESDDLHEGREAIERLKDDLFADDDEASKSGLSTHEARMAALQEQIVELESENVGKKDWVLMGEATSRVRPQNALLEEDLEFERLMKAVPVVTDEVVQDLEARIKARIVEGRFDDVVRKRAVDEKPFLPSRMFELQDTKSKESLAQIYENEFMATQTSGTSDDRDGKLLKEHGEIEKLWEGICYKLDALCNAHFIPKQPKATISTVSNVSAVSLESALPTAKAASTILAPEEVYAPTASDLRSKDELTPGEKQALRAKERKKRKKQRETLDKSVDKFAKLNRVKGVKKQKEAALKSVAKSGKGVTIIGKKSQDLKKVKKPPKS
ncbi:U3 small nucleolar ribonucleoprotein complex, subunit Mpp10 [Phellopilus nigrolimitatus]|nr:U3 small nucleolar ribonucleoprotein complex, subunit Mpp10 [Phellopilus nigrolimitatus]